MRAAFDTEPRLLLLSVHSPSEGMLYLVARNRGYLKEPASLSDQWRGTPVYQVTRGYEIAVSSPITAGTATETLDGVFVIMGREDLYPVLRDDLYLFLAFLLVSSVLILIVMSVQPDSPQPPRGGPGQGGRPASPGGQSASGGQGGSWRDAPGNPGSPGDPSVGAPGQGGSGLVSPRTGLVWAEHLDPRLSAELERASTSDQDLAFARIRIDEPYADSNLPLVYVEIARLLKESFPLPDCIFETGSDSYSLLLPEVDIDGAVKSLDELRIKVSKQPVAGRKRPVSIGVSSRGGRLIDGPVLVEEADISVAKASREGGNQVVGFRADPARFREALSGSRR